MSPGNLETNAQSHRERPFKWLRLILRLRSSRASHILHSLICNKFILIPVADALYQETKSTNPPFSGLRMS